MATPTTGSTFLDLIRKSNLLPPGKLDEYLAALSNPDALSPAELAERLVRDRLVTKFQANHLLKGRYKNFFIGKYKILQPLGSGGMSQVFLCEHTAMRHRVAMKMLPMKENTDPASVGRFLREARAAAAVNHPNVVRAHDFDKADGKYYYLIMDYVDGVNLHDLVKAVGPLPPAQAANYVAQAAAGLQHIGDMGLVHRDIKPSNLLLDRDGAVKILDLGLARFAEGTTDNVTQQYQNNSVLGTADYLAPEQALMAESLDRRADIYSLGATLYFLLTGAAPFENSSVTQKLLAHQLREPPPPAGAPAEMQAIVRTMMRKNPADRYQTGDDVIRALEAWLREPVPPPDPAAFPDRDGPSGDGPPSVGPRSGQRSTASLTGTRTPPPRPAPLRPGSTSGLFQSSILPAMATNPHAPPTTAVTPPPKRGNTLALAGAGAAVLIAVVGVALFALKPFGGTPAPQADAGPPAASTPAPAEPIGDGLPPPAGSLVVSAAGPLKTVAAALARAAPGGRVVVTDAEHAENLVVEGVKPNVTVQGWPEGRPVRWVAPPGAPATLPLVRAGDAEGFTLTNFAFDGGGQVNVLVSLAGRCPGARVEHCTAARFKAAAVQLTGCQGEPGREVVLDRLTITGPTDGAGVRIAAAAEGHPNRHLKITRSRFDGPLGSGVLFTGPADAVDVSFCRFREAKRAVAVPGPGVRLGVAVKNCTVVDAEAGLFAENLPPAGSKFEVTSNLFVRVGKTADCPAVSGQPAFEVPPAVWYDDGFPPEKETNIPAGTRYFRKTFDLPAAVPDARLDLTVVTGFKAWVNGTLAGETEGKHYVRRVYSFPVGALLKPGKNVLAVEATHTLDPIDPGFAVAAGLVARLGPPAGKPILTSDATWVANDAAAPDWQAAAFKDADWKPVKVWNKAGYRFPWQGAVWDAAVVEQLAGRPPFPLTAAGNVRDYASGEGYPVLGAVRGRIPELAKNPDDDATYLRTPKTPARLQTAAADGGPVGVPAEK